MVLNIKSSFVAQQTRLTIQKCLDNKRLTFRDHETFENGPIFKGLMVSRALIIIQQARVAELVDALDLGSSSGDRVGVQVSPLAPEITQSVLEVRFTSDT